MRLNKKGYLAVEIILSSVIAMTIAFFLISLTMKLTDKNNDTYMDNILFTDKMLITKNIKELIEKDIGSSCGIDNVSCDSNRCTILYKTSVGEFEKELKVSSNKISYGPILSDSNNYEYYKEFNKSLSLGTLNYMSNSFIVSFSLSANTLYSSYDYGFNFSVINERSGNNGKIYVDYYQDNSKLDSLSYDYNTCDPNFDWYVDISNDLNVVSNPIINKVDCYSDLEKTNKYTGEIRAQGTILEFSSDIPLILYCDVNN